MFETFLQYIMPALGTAIGALLTALCGFLIIFINKKKEDLEKRLHNDMAAKYLDMVTDTITNCVQATNQTYVDELKKQNAFTKENQLNAFNLTLNAVSNILTDDCKEYLSTITEDVEAYLKAKIEAEVNFAK